MLTIRARIVVPVAGPVIEDGAVSIDGDRIVAVGSEGGARKGETIDYGDAVICPGFVNAHTHFELTDRAGRVPPSPDFTNWLARLMQDFTATPPDRDSIQRAMREGIEQSLRAGVTTIGDITRFPHWTREVFGTSALSGVSFGEVIAIGARRGWLGERLSAALDDAHATAAMHIGVSPHAPYTVEPEAMRTCARRAAGRPTCIHLAETKEESRFTRHREGPLADYLRSLGVWDDDIPVAGLDPIPLAHGTGLLTPRTIVAHANYVTDKEIALLASSGASVAYCPRTHAAFEHEPHRFRDMLGRGVNVCIGTDSLASNPSLSVLDELRFIHIRHPDIPCEMLLHMGTIHGVRALGMKDSTGTLRIGARASLVVIPLPESAGNWTAMFRSTTEPLAVYAGGQRIEVA